MINKFELINSHANKNIGDVKEQQQQKQIKLVKDDVIQTEDIGKILNGINSWLEKAMGCSTEEL